MHRCIVRLKYGTETGRFWLISFHIGSQLLQLLHTDESTKVESRKHLMLEFSVAEIVACGF